MAAVQLLIIGASSRQCERSHPAATLQRLPYHFRDYTKPPNFRRRRSLHSKAAIALIVLSPSGDALETATTATSDCGGNRTTDYYRSTMVSLASYEHDSGEREGSPGGGGGGREDEFVALSQKEWMLRHEMIQQRPRRRTLPTAVTLLSVHLGWKDYLISLAKTITEPRSVRGKQFRLTLWEVLELFDLVNDTYFLIRVIDVAYKTSKSKSPEDLDRVSTGKIAVVSLGCSYLVSLLFYGTRRWWIYHKIPPENFSLFIPGWSLISIKQFGEDPFRIESLFMFERLIWTYQLVMRVVEDVPQVIISTMWLLSFERDVYNYYIIAQSIILFLITSYRMSATFPFANTIAMLLSRHRPVDSPILEEAAPTTKHLMLLIALNSGTWSISHYICSYLSGNRAIRRIYLLMSFGSALLFFFFIPYWLYLVLSAMRGSESGCFSVLDTENTAGENGRTRHGDLFHRDTITHDDIEQCESLMSSVRFSDAPHAFLAHVEIELTQYANALHSARWSIAGDNQSRYYDLGEMRCTTGENYTIYSDGTIFPGMKK